MPDTFWERVSGIFSKMGDENGQRREVPEVEVKEMMR